MLIELNGYEDIHVISTSSSPQNSTNESTSPSMHDVILTLLDVEVDLSNNYVHSTTLL